MKSEYEVKTENQFLGKRLRQVAQGPAALQERGVVKCPALHHETPQRRQHPKEHKELISSMIAETEWLLRQELKPLR